MDLAKIENLYHAAIACDPKERAALLEQTDPELRREIERLLTQTSSLLDHPAWESVPDETKTLLVSGMRLGPYEIEGRLGAGGMGEVFRARDTRLERRVAIKVSNARFSSRSEDEARAISALNHPHICTLYDVGPSYLVMELVEGETLAARLKQSRLPMSEVIEYGAQIAWALAEAHAHGIVHSDLKPSNIMLTKHGVKVLDFGIAKMQDASHTGTGSQVMAGTPAYMAPEQLAGRDTVPATDLFALGMVLAEMLSNQHLAKGSWAVTATNLKEQKYPPELARMLTRLRAKSPAERPGSASEVARSLEGMLDRLSAKPTVRPAYAAAGIGALIALIAGSVWWYRADQDRVWASKEALPEIQRLFNSRPLAALLLWERGEKILPANQKLTDWADENTTFASPASDALGTTIQVQDYYQPGEWITLGMTPIKPVRLPKGTMRWRVSKSDVGEFTFVTAPRANMMLPLASSVERLKRDGTVRVPGGDFADLIDFVGWVRATLPPFDIDQFEVTNRKYQEFVDQGGYRKREYWRETLTKDGKELTWVEAMALFSDATGTPGPSTWEAGHYPLGQENYPVSGVSWYEAAAYARYAGRSLPVISQWYRTAPPDMGWAAVQESNFNGKGAIPVGSLPSLGPWGTYDVVGNVREWTATAIDDKRFILGGAWGTQVYQATDPETLLPFDRSAQNGFRTVHNEQPLSADATAPLKLQLRDFTTAKPVSDSVFDLYRTTIYAYDAKPLTAKSAGLVEETPEWTEEKINIDAGYDGERFDIHVFRPKNFREPYQSVVFFPSARVEFLTDSRRLGDMDFVDYVIKSGRALVYPVYSNTYERKRQRILPGSVDDLNLVIRWTKEVRRTVDYLVTRPEMDRSRIGYLGVSMGTAYGVFATALEQRFRTIVFLDGGMFLGPAPHGRDQVDFAPRIKAPVLMINGRYDFTFSPERSQEPLYRLLGTPVNEKRRLVFDTPHDIAQRKEDLSREVLGWLDRSMGRVN
ncbi:MAG: protein kinase [Bryobacteraceae bacterium]